MRLSLAGLIVCVGCATMSALEQNWDGFMGWSCSAILWLIIIRIEKSAK